MSNQGPVYDLVKAYHDGDLTYDELKADFADRDWPAPNKTVERYDVDFGEPNGSWREVWQAYVAGLLTKAEYEGLKPVKA